MRRKACAVCVSSVCSSLCVCRIIAKLGFLHSRNNTAQYRTQQHKHTHGTRRHLNPTAVAISAFAIVMNREAKHTHIHTFSNTQQTATARLARSLYQRSLLVIPTTMRACSAISVWCVIIKLDLRRCELSTRTPRLSQFDRTHARTSKLKVKPQIIVCLEHSQHTKHN